MVDYSPLRRELQETRNLQETSQIVLFDKCMFSNNRQRDPPARFTYGVITVTTEFSALFVQECDFFDNSYEEDYGVRGWSFCLFVNYNSCFLSPCLVAHSTRRVHISSGRLDRPSRFSTRIFVAIKFLGLHW